MHRKLIAAMTGLSFAIVALAPAPALARDRWCDQHRAYYGRHDHDGYGRGGYGYGYGNGYYGNGYHDDYYDRRRDDDDDDDAIAAGVVGLVIGGVLGYALSQNNSTQRQQRNAYQQPYAAQRVCTVRERQWDPYAGRYVNVDRTVPC